MTIDDFYEECSQILNTYHAGVAFPYRKRTRWNNRTAGRGRFPERGIVRVFGHTDNAMVQISLRNPQISHTCQGLDNALDYLKTMVNE